MHLSGKKRGQLTIFIILGLLLFFFVFFLIFLKQNLSREQTEARSSQILDEQKRLVPVKVYLDSCLYTVTEEAFLIAGKQGSRFYTYQLGDYAQKNYLSLQNNVSYGVFYDYSRQPFAQAPPLYPRQRFDSGVDPIAYFGDNKIPILCEPNGINYRIQYDTTKTLTKNLSVSTKIITCDSYGTNSFQESIEKYIVKRINQCFNETIAEELFQIKMKTGEAKADVLFTDNDVKVYLKYPLTLSYEGGTDVTTYLDFSTSLNIRFKKIYGIADKIAQRDATDVLWKKNDLNDTQKILRFYTDQHINITVTCPYCQNQSKNYDDLITITDYSSNIKGKPYQFSFAVTNRPPALNYLGNKTRVGAFTKVGNEYDYVILEGEVLNFTPYANDPDEDEVQYFYRGWQETQKEFFDISCCQGYSTTGQIPCRLDRRGCVKVVNETPLLWTSSDVFLKTKKDALYQTKITDIGEHTITIIAKEKNQNLTDWQDIKVLVYDRPSAVLSKSNLYDDIDDKYGSIEDPYIINATGSSSIFGYTNYTWIDENEPFTYRTDRTVISIPEKPNIDYELNQMFFKEGPHKISLTVNNELATDTELFMLEVKKCLPHKRNFSAPYPYNNMTFDNGIGYYNDTNDPFQATHMCCEETGGYSAWNRQCYNYTEFGGYMSFDKNLFGSLSSLYRESFSNSVQTLFTLKFNPAIRDNDSDNDIYQRIYKRNCGFNGEATNPVIDKRGNICDGLINESFIRVENCTDITRIAPDNFTKRCTGPRLNFFKEGTATSIFQNPGCYNYSPGDTFEEYETDPTFSTNTGQSAFTYCGENFRCSTYNQTRREADQYTHFIYGTYGITNMSDPNFGYDKYYCTGLCDGKGGCSVGDRSNCTCNTNDCGASAYCEGKKPFTNEYLEVATGNCSVIEPWHQYICDSKCGARIAQATDDEFYFCKVTGSNCAPGTWTTSAPLYVTNPLACEEQMPDFRHSTLSGVYCTANCTALYCGEYNFDKNNNQCYTTCNAGNAATNCARTSKCELTDPALPNYEKCVPR